ncbi:MAG: DUF1990 domain-containing protein [Bacteroidetes bacterium]|nr:DUF1990 domain-containing protein [Bacteroidota bacterium]
MSNRDCPDKLFAFRRKLKDQPLSYRERGASLDGIPAGYDFDDNRVLLGQGEAIFDRAKNALDAWQMFPESWSEVCYPHPKPEPGREVGVRFRIHGIWMYCGARIIYTIREEERYGFAYGTLQTHPEKGEELFLLETTTDKKVYFRIRAFSRPNYWFVRLGYWYARYQQRRFVKTAFRQMQALCQS